MDTMTIRDLGDYGERLAARYLTEQGYTVVDRNWRCVRGEIDIVATEGRCLVVCEVKTRRSEAFGAPFEAVGRRKVRRLRQLAGQWLEQRADAIAWPGGARGTDDVRIDIVSILRPTVGPVTLTHLRGVE